MGHGVADEGRDWLCWRSPGCRCWLREQPVFPQPLLSPATAAAGRRGKSCCKERAGKAPAALPSQSPPWAVRKATTGISALCTSYIFLKMSDSFSFCLSTGADIYRHPLKAEALLGSISHKTHWQIVKAGMNLYNEDHLQFQVLSLWICAWCSRVGDLKAPLRNYIWMSIRKYFWSSVNLEPSSLRTLLYIFKILLSLQIFKTLSCWPVYAGMTSRYRRWLKPRLFHLIWEASVYFMLMPLVGGGYVRFAFTSGFVKVWLFTWRF